jgi:hypothetical protein
MNEKVTVTRQTKKFATYYGIQKVTVFRKTHLCSQMNPAHTQSCPISPSTCSYYIPIQSDLHSGTLGGFQYKHGEFDYKD